MLNFYYMLEMLLLQENQDLVQPAVYSPAADGQSSSVGSGPRLGLCGVEGSSPF